MHTKQVKFDELGLSPELLKAVVDMGFEEATPIQALAIRPMMEGKDVCGQAQTGTGKTAAFGIPILEKIDIKDKRPQAIILCPTRELAIQIAEEFKNLSKYKRGVCVLPVYGGQPIERQLYALARGVQVIIGTPGRVMDHMERRTLNLSSVKIVILDEADVMLDMGFVDDIEMILRGIPKERQTAFFSATMPSQFLELTKRYQKHPQVIKIAREELTVPTVEQAYFETTPSMKVELLSRLLDLYNPKLALVFCNTKKCVDELAGHLQTRGYPVEALHGDLRQASRDRVMAKFRNGQVSVLIATDVAARGIDVDDVEIVFNYDLPKDQEYYVHRIGRTARAGKSGRAFTFVVGREIYELKDIQRYAKIHIKRSNPPSASDVAEVRFNAMLERVRRVAKEGHLSKYTTLVEKILEEELTSLDVAAALFKIAVGDGDRPQGGDDGEFGDTGAREPGMVRFFINIGRVQGVQPKDFVRAIAETAGISSKAIGAIRICERFSFVEVAKENARQIMTAVKGIQIKGRPVNIEPANQNPH
jgi:ATP-dependent RNA helicase DeaD